MIAKIISPTNQEKARAQAKAKAKEKATKKEAT
jgi:hypothetical protein